MQLAAPAELYLPVAQATQAVLEVEPVLGLALPAVHEVHDACPVLGLYVPAAQLVQLEAPAELYLPTAQATQAVLEVEPVFGLAFPAGHCVHDVALIAEEYVPDGQDVQEVDPAALYVPAGQPRHVVLPEVNAERFPAGQLTHPLVQPSLLYCPPGQG